MKNLNARIRTAAIHALICLFALCLNAGPANAADSDQGARPSLELRGAMTVDTPATAHFDLGGYVLPMGAYTSINVTVVAQPAGAKPTVRAGYPDTMVTFHAPGVYVVDFHLSQVSKSSCGGVTAQTLLETQRTLNIR